jgi:xyloglucan:xyloglucosyl transferase
MASKIMSLFLSMILLVGLVSSAKFDELFQPYWASDHFTYEGELLHMKLDNYSGIYIFHSKNSIFNSFSARWTLLLPVFFYLN